MGNRVSPFVKKTMTARTSISVSVRRHFIDNFFFSKSNLYSGKIIDIGGKKKNKRGLFDISKFGTEVTYVNIDGSTEPDIIADASSIPLPDETFDLAIIAELLEHVPDPVAVLREAHRLIKPGGKILVTIPFMVGIHGDPQDFARYTPTFLEKASREAGFNGVEIETHGTIFAVAAL